ncbi:hypothetical protein DPMN_010070 [Dreissena polymorpha]|uniref:Uncharacterized protein n=1 Tax=Dreissena polymorpha TaxID=45954 RepID=A0A9D4N2G1_DREPO|nr:hypothetical protein DPMN_010070 [Dreissena polymorpha]
MLIKTRVLTRKKAPSLCGHLHEDRTINVVSRAFTRKNAPSPWWPYIIWTNLLTKFHDDWIINVASRVLTRKKCPAPGGHVFQPTGIIFELIQHIIGMNLLTKCHEDWKKMWPLEINAPPLGCHTNLLTKFHEDWTIKVAYRVLRRQMLRPHDGRRTKAHHERIVHSAGRTERRTDGKTDGRKDGRTDNAKTISLLL